MKKIVLGALVLIVASGASVADTPIEYMDSYDRESSQDQTEMTESEVQTARQLKLTKSDWSKYKKIMEGPWKYWNSDLDPVTALGVSEKDPQERKRYARIWMQVETAKVDGILAFERDRMQAARDLLGDQKLIENGPWIEKWERDRKAIKTTINYFVDARCKAACTDTTTNVLASVSATSKLDIFFAKGASEDNINEWATYNKIDPKDVAARKITLNYERGNATRLDVNMAELPQVRVVDRVSGEITAKW